MSVKNKGTSKKLEGVEYYKGRYMMIYFQDQNLIEKARKFCSEHDYTMSKLGMIAVREKLAREEELQTNVQTK